MKYLKTAFVLSVIAAGATWSGVSLAATENGPIKNIVLVHGAFVDGSGWKPVYDILIRDGYHVSVVQQPLTSLSDDVAATKRILARQEGPCVLVGHSYGGAIITVAGNDPHVYAAVYCELQASNTRGRPGFDAGTEAASGHAEGRSTS